MDEAAAMRTELFDRAPAFADPSNRDARTRKERGWTISLARSVQHFAAGGESNCGAYTEGAAAVGGLGCVETVCPSQFELALASIQNLSLPLAIIGGDLFYDMGR